MSVVLVNCTQIKKLNEIIIRHLLCEKKLEHLLKIKLGEKIKVVLKKVKRHLFWNNFFFSKRQWF